MLWGQSRAYEDEPFEIEADLEEALLEARPALFGSKRVYLDTKKKIGKKAKIEHVPDGYLIDLSSAREPKLYVVENELAKDEPLTHVAMHILEFSLSFETNPHHVKSILKEALLQDPASLGLCQQYATTNGFENTDVLLERMVCGEDRFNALIIIDELSDELERALLRRFRFPVEVLTFQRYRSEAGERIYSFEPFMSDISLNGNGSGIDPTDIDTIVVPAHEDGFKETFIGENRWHAIRIHSTMIPRIKHIAVYRTVPESAITHIAPVSSIKTWKGTTKYVVNLAAPAVGIGPIRLVPKGTIKAPQGPRYTARGRLETAENLDEAF